MSTLASDPTLPRLMTAAEVAAQTGIPLPSVYELSREGRLPVIALGRRYRYDPAALRRWMAAGGVRGT